MPVVVVISQHLLNLFLQLANKRGLKKITVSFETPPTWRIARIPIVRVVFIVTTVTP
jgi:hypothetical protein